MEIWKNGSPRQTVVIYMIDQFTELVTVSWAHEVGWYGDDDFVIERELERCYCTSSAAIPSAMSLFLIDVVKVN
jgi:hypothetical protein